VTFEEARELELAKWAFILGNNGRWSVQDLWKKDEGLYNQLEKVRWCPVCFYSGGCCDFCPMVKARLRCTTQNGDYVCWVEARNRDEKLRAASRYYRVILWLTETGEPENVRNVE
jgi:hypothetical protein